MCTVSVLFQSAKTSRLESRTSCYRCSSAPVRFAGSFVSFCVWAVAFGSACVSPNSDLSVKVTEMSDAGGNQRGQQPFDWAKLGESCDPHRIPSETGVCLLWPSGYLSAICKAPAGESQFAQCGIRTADTECAGSCERGLCIADGSTRLCIRSCSDDSECRTKYRCKKYHSGSGCVPSFL
jgi:hypothetical protein